MAAILVIDPSPTVRETVRIVLGAEHEVVLASSWDDVPPGVAPAVVMFGAAPSPRDDHAAGAARARLAPDAPLLLLHAPEDIDAAALAPTAHPIAYLPKPFDGHALRVQVQRLLSTAPRAAPSPSTIAHHRRSLEPPFLTHAAAALARRAVLADVPVLLSGEHGSGAFDIARAIHFFAGASGPIVVRSAAHVGHDLLPEGSSLAPAPGALVLEDVHLLSREGQAALLALCRAPDPTRSVPRVFAVTAADLDGCVAAGTFLPELAHALTVLPIALTPLRDRMADIPALVVVLIAALAERLRLEAVVVTEDALERLQRYLWFGNVAELEAVLARTLAVHRPRLVEADMLLFRAADAAGALGAPAAATAGAATPDGRERSELSASAAPGDRARGPAATAPAAPTASSAPPPAIAPSTSSAHAPPARGRVVPLERRRFEEPVDAGIDRSAGSERSAAAAGIGARPTATASEGAVSRSVSAGPSLEVLLGELAHELRNPMVTIKTFAQHLDSVLEDAEVRARFAALTTDAIGRMDTLLETLLDFARFRAPLPQPIDLGALLARALDERADVLARRGVGIEHHGHGHALVLGDESQMLFALRSLVDGVLPDLVAHMPVRFTSRADGALELSVHAERAIATRLVAWVADADASAGAPLAIALAAALVQRNGGGLVIRDADGTTVITVTLPPPAAEQLR